MQPEEQRGQIFIYIIDETYEKYDDEQYSLASENYRKQLEIDFDAEFCEVNIGPGADVPAFLTLLSTVSVPAWTVIFTLFFAGKKINENIEAWTQLAAKIHGFFRRPVALGRHAAAIVALQSIFDELDGLPKSIKLDGYVAEHIGEDSPPSSYKDLQTIDPSPPTLNVSSIRHVFKVQADGIDFLVKIYGRTPTVTRFQPLRDTGP